MADDVAQMIEDCEARDSKMSEWEQGFISNIARQLQQGRDLTPKQVSRLETIWNKVTDG